MKKWMNVFAVVLIKFKDDVSSIRGEAKYLCLTKQDRGEMCSIGCPQGVSTLTMPFQRVLVLTYVVVVLL